MGRFNLLDEPWISVVTDYKGTTKEVSLKEFFNNAHLYIDLAGDMKTQDFAILRLLLAVMHTVFSRFDAHGKKYDYIELDDRFKQVEKIEEEDVKDYTEDLYNTWFDLWESEKFPGIINEYLEKWRDRFYLFDEKYPFFQVIADDIKKPKINKSKPTEIAGKNINRLISESGNKSAIFSCKYEYQGNKDFLTYSQVTRWLITFQGYTGLSDKTIFGKQKYKVSKGWLYDIGGINLGGSNLFETLMLNCVLAHDENNNLINIQKPCWEFSSSEVIQNYFCDDSINNLASLYTAWSRGIYIDPNINLNYRFLCHVVKLPEINHGDKFLEPMTVWEYNFKGDNKGKYTPRKHILNKAMWRSFGLIMINEAESNQRKPGVIEWINKIKIIAQNNNKKFDKLNSMIFATSMQDDGNPKSRVPTDEIIDSLSINEYVITDLEKDGWVIRINDVVNETKGVIENCYKNFLKDVFEIRAGKNKKDFNDNDKRKISEKVEELYFKIDTPFRKWIASIEYKDNKEEKITEWREKLKYIVEYEAKLVFQNGTSRDYMGIVEDGKVKNIATVYNNFIHFLYKKIGRK